jgi:hypothetical protein
MSAIRTQVYFTEQQRQALDEIAARDKTTLAALVREAVDAYLAHTASDPDVVLDDTFGSIPDLQIPSREEWDRGCG